MADVKRFAEISEEEITRVLEEKDSLNTRKATVGAIRLLNKYLAEKGLPEQIECYQKSEMDRVLSRFFLEVRQENGEMYKRSSLFSLRHGINRYLQSKTNNAVDIMKDKEFLEIGKIFPAVAKDLKRKGKGGVDHYPPIDSDDLQKMYSYFDLNDPSKLQEKVFVDIQLYFGRRGRENLRELKVSDFACTTDGSGSLYMYMNKDEVTKNHQDDANSANGRMYAKPDDVLCPVKTFIKYKRHLNPNNVFLFQRPKRKIKEGEMIWFENAPLGHNTLGNLMPRISVNANLSVIILFEQQLFMF